MTIWPSVALRAIALTNATRRTSTVRVEVALQPWKVLRSPQAGGSRNDLFRTNSPRGACDATTGSDRMGLRIRGPAMSLAAEVLEWCGSSRSRLQREYSGERG